jgi:GTP cyclohydrolase III
LTVKLITGARFRITRYLRITAVKVTLEFVAERVTCVSVFVREIGGNNVLACAELSDETNVR